MKLKEKLIHLIWNNQVIPEQIKFKLYHFYKNLTSVKTNISVNESDLKEHINNILNSQFLDNSFSINFPKISEKISLTKNDPKLIAFYLPQYCPDKYNDSWWGKGSTEWTNVGKSVPQYVGHYQPRCPGELGYYDLRIKDNIRRQVELATIFGIYGFCFYYYWFDGVRLLREAFDNFLGDNDIKFPFAICWANENWTKQWANSSNAVLIEQSHSEESYRNFIKDVCCLFQKSNYITIDNKPLLMIYRPLEIPNCKSIIDYWRSYVYKELKKEIYITGVVRKDENILELGFDACNEFSPNNIIQFLKIINNEKKLICNNFTGHIYDYEDLVLNKKFFKVKNLKTYRAICPMWDNTPRRKSSATILDGATPSLYKTWLKELIKENKKRDDLDDNLIFINAWNEWAEGAYMEPDLFWKYGYLEATKDAIIQTRIQSSKI